MIVAELYECPIGVPFACFSWCHGCASGCWTYFVNGKRQGMRFICQRCRDSKMLITSYIVTGN